MYAAWLLDWFVTLFDCLPRCLTCWRDARSGLFARYHIVSFVRMRGDWLGLHDALL